MVRITSDRYIQAYERIKRDSLDGNCIIFVAPDVDAICCCKILQSLLKRDIIQHKIVPVSGYQDLKKANVELVAKDEQLRTIILINCGGLVDVSEFLQVNNLVTLYILDSHRPLHLDNITGDNNICVFDDDDENEKMTKLIEVYEELIYHDSSDEDGDEEDDDDDDETDDERTQSDRPKQRRKLNEGGSYINKRAQLKEREEMIKDYYSSLYYANSSAGQMYILANQLGKTDNELLWLAIIGVTAQYIFERNDTTKYMDYVKRFSDDVTLFNVSAQGGPKVAEDSIQFSLQQCHQVYTHMDMDLKNILRNKIETVAPLYGLTDICFPSFSRTFGWKYRLSASDVVYALATLLETSPSAAAALGESVHWNDDQDWGELDDMTDNHDNDLGSHRWYKKRNRAVHEDTKGHRQTRHGDHRQEEHTHTQELPDGTYQGWAGSTLIPTSINTLQTGLVLDRCLPGTWTQKLALCDILLGRRT
ncbi:hypothetical protein [Absidia glauca]|uniref:Uncharacterized protein n=1 Tax=Absidia glauca TaxID=4829 RepID=A0A163KG73_ABSGL|nr:hypothetical protein [Absidia glauca]